MHSDRDGESLFSIERGSSPDEGVVRLSGEIDLSNAPGLTQRLLTSPLFEARRVVVDLDDVTFLDSSGLGLLVALRKQALHEADGDFAVINAHGVVARALEVSGLSDVMVEGGSAEKPDQSS